MTTVAAIARESYIATVPTLMIRRNGRMILNGIRRAVLSANPPEPTKINLKT